jgi:hypothetical protein
MTYARQCRFASARCRLEPFHDWFVRVFLQYTSVLCVYHGRPMKGAPEFQRCLAVRGTDVT